MRATQPDFVIRLSYRNRLLLAALLVLVAAVGLTSATAAQAAKNAAAYARAKVKEERGVGFRGPAT